MSELKLCPLCGKDGMIEQTCPHYGHNVPKKYFPKCSNENCALFNPSIDGEFGDVYRDYATPEEATAAWNTRPLEDALQAKIEALEVKAKALDLLAEMAKAGQVVEIRADAEVVFVQNNHWGEAKKSDDFHYSVDICNAIAAAYAAWKGEQE